jgi:hypothetical protein
LEANPTNSFRDIAKSLWQKNQNGRPLSAHFPIFFKLKSAAHALSYGLSFREFFISIWKNKNKRPVDQVLFFGGVKNGLKYEYLSNRWADLHETIKKYIYIKCKPLVQCQFFYNIHRLCGLPIQNFNIVVLVVSEI